MLIDLIPLLSSHEMQGIITDAFKSTAMVDSSTQPKFEEQERTDFKGWTFKINQMFML